jgi:hypothetical protein
MDPRSRTGRGWVAYSAIVLTIAGIFGVIDGLMAVYKSSFFVGNAVFVFSDLRAWGWITFGVGVAALVSGLYVLTGSQAARWTGVTVAGLSALGQLLFAQAYPLWALMIMTLDFLVIYGLAAHGGREEGAAMSNPRDIRDERPGESQASSAASSASRQASEPSETKRAA